MVGGAGGQSPALDCGRISLDIRISGYQDIYPRLAEICGCAGCVGLADSRAEQSVIYEFLQPFSYDARTLK